MALYPVHSTACWVITSYPFLASPDTHDVSFARVCFVREMPGEVAVRIQAFPLSVMQSENNYSTSNSDSHTDDEYDCVCVCVFDMFGIQV